MAVPSRQARIELLARSFSLPFACAALCDDQLVGLAGFCSAEGSLTGGIDYRRLISHLGILRGSWAALVFRLYARRLASDELLMDGIAVRADMRGRGIGSRLLAELTSLACREGYRAIRLDVIDTNAGARRVYERNGFVATKTERFDYLRWLLGFGPSTTMVRQVSCEAA